MIRHITTLALKSFKIPNTLHNTQILRRSYITPIRYAFTTLPKHQVLKMPALSPTMAQGKVVKWLKKVGDQVQPGDVICDIQTDKATVGFEVQEKGYIARINQNNEPIAVGTPVVILTKKSENLKDFQNYSFTGEQKNTLASTPTPPKQSQQTPVVNPVPTDNYPKHSQLKMPALSPTMAQGKILKWEIKQGDSFSSGDMLCSIETDKAVVGFEATQKGILAKILAPEQSSLPVGSVLAVSVRKKEDADKFKDYSLANASKSESTQSKPKEQTKQSSSSSTITHQQKSKQTGDRIFASPAARMVANNKGIEISQLKGQGSGPDGRILRQDVQNFKPEVKQQIKQPQQAQKKVQTSQQSQTVSKKQIIPENPFEQMSLSGMRKTIAARLLESKTTIPHYYLNLSIAMDSINEVRNQLNKNQKQNGVKISVNDIIIKAMALALRDYPDVNAQWNTKTIKKFKHADIGVAVATEGGLITPIVFRAQTLGLLDIARRTKDIAKRARQGKLDPLEYIGGTSTISNLGMFGIDSVTSVINPPQSTILGVGRTDKKIIFDSTSTDPTRPYKVAQMCQMIVSADHRVVDGALAAQWLKRIQKYLQNPYNLLL